MLVVGVDIGTQSLKVVVTDEGLAVLGEASRGYSGKYPRPGWAEQDPALWDRALAPAVAEALANAGRQPDDVGALGVSGQLDGCVATDADGKALAPCLIWMDRRAADLVPEALIREPAEFRRKTGVVADASHMAAKIRWCRQNGLSHAARFHQPVSYLVARLTGAHVYDHGLASTTMLYDLTARAHDPALFALFDLDPSAVRLPDIRDAGSVAGALSTAGARLAGLPAGIPVAVGTGDDYATPLGAGVVRPGRVACVLGTAEVVGALSDDLVIDLGEPGGGAGDPGAAGGADGRDGSTGGLVETHRYATDAYFVENPGWMAGGALAWLSEILGVSDFQAFDALAADAPPGADGVIFLFALSGAMAPEWIAGARGCFYGLTPAHGRGHLARAVMEGCAMAMRDVTARLAALGVPCRDILALGGGARSTLWGQIRADASGLAVALAERTDTCPLGAAALAALAAGVHPDLDACAALLASESRTLEPDPARRAVYDDLHARYRLLFDGLRPLY